MNVDRMRAVHTLMTTHTLAELRAQAHALGLNDPADSRTKQGLAEYVIDHQAAPAEPPACPPHLVDTARTELIATGLHPDPDTAAINAWWQGYQQRIPDTIRLTRPPAGFPGSTPDHERPHFQGAVHVNRGGYGDHDDDPYSIRCPQCLQYICNVCDRCGCPPFVCPGHHDEED